MSRKSGWGRSMRRRLWVGAGVCALLGVVSLGGVLSQTTDEYVVLSWSDTGMHSAGKDFSVLALSPPFSTLRAQVVKKGVGFGNPSVVTEELTLNYEVPLNTYSAGKTNFWDNVEFLFGVPLEPDVGLTGRGLSGPFSPAPTGDHFLAEGIPLTPYSDFELDVEDPYQLARVSLMDGDGNAVAFTEPVLPVSNEMKCTTCHGSEEAILSNHPMVADFDPSLPVLCVKCHASNALRASGIREAKSLSEVMHRKHDAHTNNCSLCHPGPMTRAHRGVMAKQHGLTCQDCHGNMANLADSITKGRRPWLDEPKCGTCHGAKYSEEPDKLYRDSRGHGGLFCAACHGSPHAELPSVQDKDNQQNIALQGFAGALRDCTVCHDVVPNGAGPHGIRSEM